jgi:hypothetical protein
MPETPITAEQQAELDNLFVYHRPFGDQPQRYEKLRAKGKELAEVILQLTPRSADQSAALRKVREAVFTANAAIAVNEKEPLGNPLPDPSPAQ